MHPTQCFRVGWARIRKANRRAFGQVAFPACGAEESGNGGRRSPQRSPQHKQRQPGLVAALAAKKAARKWMTNFKTNKLKKALKAEEKAKRRRQEALGTTMLDLVQKRRRGDGLYGVFRQHTIDAAAAKGAQPAVDDEGQGKGGGRAAAQGTATFSAMQACHDPRLRNCKPKTSAARPNGSLWRLYQYYAGSVRRGRSPLANSDSRFAPDHCLRSQEHFPWRTVVAVVRWADTSASSSSSVRSPTPTARRTCRAACDIHSCWTTSDDRRPARTIAAAQPSNRAAQPLTEPRASARRTTHSRATCTYALRRYIAQNTICLGELLAFCRDFDVVPQLVSKAEVTWLFSLAAQPQDNTPDVSIGIVAVSRPGREININGFKKFVVHVALLNGLYPAGRRTLLWKQAARPAQQQLHQLVGALCRYLKLDQYEPMLRFLHSMKVERAGYRDSLRTRVKEVRGC